jgi:magnesium-protoporphyrin O-methyltransferase
VVCSCYDFRDAADRQFTDAKAAKELDVYRRGRVGTTTLTIREAVEELGLNNGSLLDIGGGFGPLTFELLERGMPRATIVDASSSYIAAAREEAARRGRPPAIELIHGDVVQLDDAVPDASLVTLDRVVCCYPTYEPLLQLGARHAKHALALSYPARSLVRPPGHVARKHAPRQEDRLPHLRSPATLRALLPRMSLIASAYALTRVDRSFSRPGAITAGNAKRITSESSH